jgi:subfamily B ATP-binding cassette protein MsbA
MIKDDLRSLFGYAWPYRWPLALAGGLMLVESAASLAVPWLVGQLTTTLFGTGRAVLSLNAMFGLQAALFAGYGSLSMAHGYLFARVEQQVISQLRVRVYEHLQLLPLDFYHERRKGEALDLLTHDVETVGSFIGTTLMSMAPLGLTCLGAFVMMMRVDWVLAGLVGLTVPVFFLVLQATCRQVRPLSAELADARARVIATAEENLSLLPVIKAFTRETEASTQYHDHVRRLAELNMRYFLVQSRLAPIMQLVSTAGILSVLWLASQKVVAGRLGSAELVSFVMYGLLLTRRMSAFASAYAVLQYARAAMSRLLGVLAVAPEPQGRTKGALSRVRGAIEFQHVSFAYAGRPNVFDQLSLKVAPGETIGITGCNGAGKSTLVNLLMRFSDQQSGTILIDGTDIRTVPLASLRTQIGLVPQSVLLFNRSVRDNIAYGRPNATQRAIEEAARVAGAHDFISGLPDGYETTIGERGVKLSGGQQQRIALARALLKDPPILILDEATAMFDPVGEDAFVALGEATLTDRTVLLITHRAASLALADRIVLIEGGVAREVQSGRQHQYATTGASGRTMTPYRR